MLNTIHFLLGSLLVTCSLLAAFSLNPVESILFLILSFYLSACILFLFNVEFLALLYVVVYVGAVAVLFLFIIMMLDIKIKKNFFNQYKVYIYFFLVSFIYILFISILIYLEGTFFALETHDSFNALDTDSLSNIDVFGLVLFNYYAPQFLIGGIILLISLVGCIVITINHNKKSNLSKTS